MHERGFRRALVLSGGGARGAYEAGVVAALCEREQFDIISGTSIGAINAALAAQGATDHLREIWQSIPERAMIRAISPLRELWTMLPRHSGARRRKLREFALDLAAGLGALRRARLGTLRQLTHLLDPAPVVDMLTAMLDYRELKRTLIVGVTNLTLARPEAFYSFVPQDAEYEANFARQEWASVRLSAENYVSAVLASAAIPLAFPKVSIADGDGTISDYLDGGIGNNTPIRQAIDAGADEITVVVADHIALRDRTHRMDDLGSIALVVQDILQQQVLELDLKLTRRVNEAVLRGAAPGKRFVRIRTIGPTVAIPLPILGFDSRETIDRAFQQGLVDGRGACDAGGLARLFATDPAARRLRTGEVLFREGDLGDEMFVITEGEFVVAIRGGEIGTLGPGEAVGELAILGSRKRLASVTAKTQGTVVPVDRRRFAYLVQYAPTFALVVLRSLAGLLRNTRDIEGMALESREDGATLGSAPAGLAGEPASVLSFAPGQSIFEPGDAGDAMFVVLDGRVDVGSEAGSVAIARAGEVFGEMALGDGLPRRTRAVASTAARVVAIDPLRFTDLVQSNPNFAIEVMRRMAERMLQRVDAVAK